MATVSTPSAHDVAPLSEQTPTDRELLERILLLGTYAEKHSGNASLANGMIAAGLAITKMGANMLAANGLAKPLDPKETSVKRIVAEYGSELGEEGKWQIIVDCEKCRASMKTECVQVNYVCFVGNEDAVDARAFRTLGRKLGVVSLEKGAPAPCNVDVPAGAAVACLVAGTPPTWVRLDQLPWENNMDAARVVQVVMQSGIKRDATPAESNMKQVLGFKATKKGDDVKAKDDVKTKAASKTGVNGAATAPSVEGTESHATTAGKATDERKEGVREQPDDDDDLALPDDEDRKVGQREKPDADDELALPDDEDRKVGQREKPDADDDRKVGQRGVPDAASMDVDAGAGGGGDDMNIDAIEVNTDFSDEPDM